MSLDNNQRKHVLYAVNEECYSMCCVATNIFFVEI